MRVTRIAAPVALMAVLALAVPPAHGGLIVAISADTTDNQLFDQYLRLVDPLDPSHEFSLPAGIDTTSVRLRKSVSLSGTGRYLALSDQGSFQNRRFLMIDRNGGQPVELPAPTGSDSISGVLTPDAATYAYATAGGTNNGQSSTRVLDVSAFPTGPFPDRRTTTATVTFSDGTARIVRPTGKPAATNAGKVAWTWESGAGDDAPGGVVISPPSGTPRVVSFKPPALGSTLRRVEDPTFAPSGSSSIDELTYTSRPSAGSGSALGRISLDSTPTFDALSLPGLSFVSGRSELFPVWTPSARYLAFLELGPSAGGLRSEARIKVYDTQTQQLVLPAGRAVTPVVRADSLAIAETPSVLSTFSITGTAALLNRGPVNLLANLTAPTSVGILVQRITGTTKLLGRRVPRLQPVGRVPLGPHRRGSNRIPWNGKVNGRRLAPGRYQVTLRAVKGLRVTDLSRPVQLRVPSPRN